MVSIWDITKITASVVIDIIYIVLNCYLTQCSFLLNCLPLKFANSLETLV